jgi:hypothetical protein
MDFSAAGGAESLLVPREHGSSRPWCGYRSPHAATRKHLYHTMAFSDGIKPSFPSLSILAYNPPHYLRLPDRPSEESEQGNIQQHNSAHIASQLEVRPSKTFSLG